MTAYILKKRNRNKKIVSDVVGEYGYIFKPNIKNTKLISVNRLFLLNETMINQLLLKQYNKSFRRLATITYSVLNDEDSTSTDAIIALDEVARQKERLIKKDKEYLIKEEEQKLLKRFKMLEKELKSKLVLLKEEEEKSYTR